MSVASVCKFSSVSAAFRVGVRFLLLHTPLSLCVILIAPPDLLTLALHNHLTDYTNLTVFISITLIHAALWISCLTFNLNCIRTLRRKSILHPTSQNLSKLQFLETQLQNKLLIAKSSYENNLVTTSSRTNTSKIFKYIDSITKGSTIPQTVCLDSHTASSDSEKAFLFNVYIFPLSLHSKFIHHSTH